ncbi:hypothetical protein [Mycobacterium hubeiense]|uniref:hypothetical protein n=1 Tax=Mycobacterium hubeiense TaxID=1867256 RepID=UPI000C7EC9CA|nr:hypothetical protein [Mycobacterium sp. QGD 101]
MSEDPGAEAEFAAGVLRKLLHRINDENAKGRDLFLVSHAWTDGPIMCLVYTAPPSHITWGLVRDTRNSIINPGPWQHTDDPALYYYLLDLEEGRVSASFPHPGNTETILWHGVSGIAVPERPADIPAGYRYTPPIAESPDHRRQHHESVVNEPRRYADPL